MSVEARLERSNECLSRLDGVGVEERPLAIAMSLFAFTDDETCSSKLLKNGCGGRVSTSLVSRDASPACSSFAVFRRWSLVRSLFSSLPPETVLALEARVRRGVAVASIATGLSGLPDLTSPDLSGRVEEPECSPTSLACADVEIGVGGNCGNNVGCPLSQAGLPLVVVAVEGAAAGAAGAGPQEASEAVLAATAAAPPATPSVRDVTDSESTPAAALDFGVP